MSETEKRRWFFRAHVVDRAGALTSIASAFSNENISIETVVGHGLEKQVGVDGSVILTFSCSEENKDIMVRKIKRLSKVIRLEERPYESEAIRKSVIILASRELMPRDVVGETAFLVNELMSTDASGWTYFLAGAATEVNLVLERLETAGVIKDIIYSILGL